MNNRVIVSFPLAMLVQIQIANELNISTIQVMQAMQQLERLRYVQKGPDGWIILG